jgi:hypothetical protein
MQALREVVGPVADLAGDRSTLSVSAAATPAFSALDAVPIDTSIRRRRGWSACCEMALGSSDGIGGGMTLSMRPPISPRR